MASRTATVRRILALAVMALLAACASGGGGVHRLVPDTPVKIGRPYAVNGRSYVPYDDTRYDKIGEASWYGSAEQGRHTASGEIFYKQRASAAHTTLPLPSYVEVTRLDTGRRILVRVNDRGPYARDRIIDLSLESARQLGIDRAGRAMVRVRRVTPSAREKDQLRRGYAIVLSSVSPTATPLRVGRTATPPPAPAPAPAPGTSLPPASAPAGAEYLPEPPAETYSAPLPSPRPIILPSVAQPASPPPQVTVERDILIAQPSDPDAADALATATQSEGGHVVASGAGYRVVTGPYPDEASCAAALARLRARGYQGVAALDAAPASRP